MSGARRKSKNPQKWEESFSPDDLSKLSDSFNLKHTQGSESNAFYQSRQAQGYSSNTEYPLGEATAKEGGGNEGEMTVLDVLQGSRQGFVAECKVCLIQIKDWESTANHIHSHRMVYIPLCIRDSNNFSSKQPAMCMLCQKVYQSSSELAFHAHSKHNFTLPPFMCPFCGRTFPTCSLLQRHIDVREICLKCPVCSATHNQIYDLFSHLSDCLPTFHPHLKSLVCHVCKHRILMGSLAEHMVHHSLQRHEGQPPKQAILDSSPSRNLGPDSPSPDDSLRSVFLCEICDGRFSCFDTFKKHLYDHVDSKIYCPSCFLKGFERPELVVRHLMLRCPRRSSEQFEFGSVISLIGKEKRLNFLQVMREILHLRPFREGLLAWSPFPMVREVLLNADKFVKEAKPRLYSPTDIELLTWLSEFEKQLQRQQPKMWKGESKEEGDSQKVGAVNTPILKIAANDNIDKLDGIVTSLDHRPFAAEIRRAYPGVALLNDVDVKRLKPLYEEALTLMGKDVLTPFIESGAFTANDFVRLEYEAQYLRQNEPFYLSRGEEWKKFSPFRMSLRRSQNVAPSDVSSETMERILAELKELRKEHTPLTHNATFTQAQLDALLQEAKGGS